MCASTVALLKPLPGSICIVTLAANCLIQAAAASEWNLLWPGDAQWSIRSISGRVAKPPLCALLWRPSSKCALHGLLIGHDDRDILSNELWWRHGIREGKACNLKLNESELISISARRGLKAALSGVFDGKCFQSKARNRNFTYNPCNTYRQK